MEYKNTESVVTNLDGRVVSGIACVFGVVVDGYDVVIPGAFAKSLQEDSSRVKFLWQHDSRQPPIAVIRNIQEIGVDILPPSLVQKGASGGLLVVREYLDTARGNEILEGIRTGAITEMSFAFDPVRFSFVTLNGKTVRKLEEVRLWEISDVLWGMNRLTQAVVSSKAAIPYMDRGVESESAEWVAPNMSDFTDETNFESLDESERIRIGAHFTFSETYPPEKYSDLKLPHHVAEKKGVGKAVWSGVRAAMGALMGARGGVDIPDEDRAAVYKHLAKHYEQFGKVPPDFKQVQKSYYMSAVGEEKVGRVLSSQNADKIRQAISILEEILGMVYDSTEDQKSKKVSVLKLKNRIEQLQKYYLEVEKCKLKI